MEWIVLGTYTVFMLAIFLVVHKRSVEGYQRVVKHWEIKCQKLIHDNETLQRRIEDRNNTVEFLKERLAEMEAVRQDTCPDKSLL